MTAPTWPIPVLFRDDHYAVVDKPSGLLVHRTAVDAGDRRSLAQELRAQLGCRVYPVHRLDKGTSGVIAFALHAEAATRLAGAFRTAAVDKRYLAVVRGYAPDAVRVDSPVRDAIDVGGRGADAPRRPAVTDVRRLAQAEVPAAVGRYATARYSLVACRPHTGRQHQVRRHLKHLRHPVIGDANYGDLAHNRFVRAAFGVARLLLAATSLRFAHPYTGAAVHALAPPADEFARVCRALGWDAVAELATATD